MTPDELAARHRAARGRRARRRRLAPRLSRRPSARSTSRSRVRRTSSPRRTARSSALIVAALQVAVSGRRVHRRGGRRRRRRPVLGHRSDRRHREFRARPAALVRVDRVRRGGAHGARRDLRPQRRSRCTRRGAARARDATRCPIRVSATDRLARATVDIGYSRRTAIDDFARHHDAAARAGRQRDAERIGGARARPRRGRSSRRLRRAPPLRVGCARRTAAGRGGGRPRQRVPRRRRVDGGNETIAATAASVPMVANALEEP